MMLPSRLGCPLSLKTPNMGNPGFDYCRPKAVVFSDAWISYDTQQMAGTYGQHASGVAFNGQHRRVLTTRNDGTLTWTI